MSHNNCPWAIPNNGVQCQLGATKAPGQEDTRAVTHDYRRQRILVAGKGTKNDAPMKRGRDVVDPCVPICRSLHRGHHASCHLLRVLASLGLVCQVSRRAQTPLTVCGVAGGIDGPLPSVQRSDEHPALPDSPTVWLADPPAKAAKAIISSFLIDPGDRMRASAHSSPAL